jgi:hypothetical protein
VTLTFTSETSRFVTSHSSSLAQLACTESFFEPVGTVTLPLWGNPNGYPFDSYDANLYVGLESTGGEPQLRTAEPGSAQNFDSTVRVYEATAIAPLALGVSVATREESPAPGLTVRLHRTALTQTYVLLIGVIPLVLELLLVTVLLGRRSESATRPGPELLAGVAAVLLAILPIRQVLVPSGIGVLTLVDYVLGLEMAILAAVACMAVRRAL